MDPGSARHDRKCKVGYADLVRLLLAADKEFVGAGDGPNAYSSDISEASDTRILEYASQQLQASILKNTHFPLSNTLYYWRRVGGDENVVRHILAFKVMEIHRLGYGGDAIDASLRSKKDDRFLIGVVEDAFSHTNQQHSAEVFL